MLRGYFIDSIKKYITTPAVVTARPIVCSYSGEIRVLINWLIYFGGMIWLAVIASFLGLFSKFKYIISGKNHKV